MTPPKLHLKFILGKKMSCKSKLEKSLKDLLKENKEDSFGTRAEREKVLDMSMKQLVERFKINDVHQLKSKHINYLVEQWKNEGKTEGTLKNRMSNLRWLAKKINKQNIVERDNKSYGIADRQYVNNDKNIAKNLDENKVNQISDPYTKLSLELQEKFGLRREEAIKFQIDYAYRVDHIALKSTWCKGGRPREIPIRTDEQRAVLEQVRRFCIENKCKSLIRNDETYKQQLKRYERETDKADELKNHGLRHQYAQTRYKELTGRDCPKCGGLTSKELTKEQKEIDLNARLKISNELGHNREDVTAVYLGR